MNVQIIDEPQLSAFVDIAKPRSILADAKRYYKMNYPKSDFGIID
jgi:hypothetical protein